MPLGRIQPALNVVEASANMLDLIAVTIKGETRTDYFFETKQDKIRNLWRRHSR